MTQRLRITQLLVALYLGAAAVTSTPAATVTGQEFSASEQYERRLTISVKGERLALLLKPSHVTRNTRLIDQAGRNISLRARSFTGVVEGQTGSWARVTLTGNNISGVVSNFGQRFQLDTNAEGRVVVRPLADNHPPGIDITHPPRTTLQRQIRNLTPAQANARVTRVAKMAIVVDSQYNDFHNGQGVEKALSIVNSVDGIFREEFGIALSVEQVITYTDSATDPFNSGAIPIETMLRNFRNYRLQNSQFNDDIGLAHLFTGNRNSDEAVGLAWIDTACRSDGFDVGLSTLYRYDIMLAAHEIAHNLGAEHDSETACRAQTNKVMWPYISANTTQHFSSCTVEAVKQAMNNSCHVDAIDLQISTYQTSADVVTAAVRNNDDLRSTPAATLTIDVPPGGMATALQGNCSTPGDQIKCDISTLFPGEQEEVVVKMSNGSDSTIFAQVDPIGFRDVHSDNNVVEIGYSDATFYSADHSFSSGSGGGTTSLIGTTRPPAASSGGSAGGGVFAIPSLLLLLLGFRISAALRLRARC